MFPEQLFIDRADGIFSERNAMLYDSGRQKYELLPPDAQVLAFCMEFEYEIRDGLQEVLASSNQFHMIEALRQIEAQQYADLLLHIMQNDFHNEQFPLRDEQTERMQNQYRKSR